MLLNIHESLLTRRDYWCIHTKNKGSGLMNHKDKFQGKWKGVSRGMTCIRSVLSWHGEWSGCMV